MRWLPQDANLKIANFSTGGIVYSSPAVANGYIYVGGYDNQVYQLNASNISIKFANLIFSKNSVFSFKSYRSILSRYYYFLKC